MWHNRNHSPQGLRLQRNRIARRIARLDDVDLLARIEALLDRNRSDLKRLEDADVADLLASLRGPPRSEGDAR